MKRLYKLALALVVVAVASASLAGCRSSGSNSGASGGRVMPRLMEGSGGR